MVIGEDRGGKKIGEDTKEWERIERKENGRLYRGMVIGEDRGKEN
jgi:hypothetical protein